MSEIDDLRKEIRKTPLAVRLRQVSEIAGRLCAESRTIRTSIPVQPTDEDILLVVTLEDARQAIADADTIAKADLERIRELRRIISDLTDEDDCSFDHHGYCQAHGWMATEPKCPHARAKEILK